MRSLVLAFATLLAGLIGQATPALSGQMPPPGYSEAFQSDDGGGHVLFGQGHGTGSARRDLAAAFGRFAGYFDSPPRPTGAFGRQSDREAQASFVTSRNGQEVAGIIMALDDGGTETSIVAYDLRERMNLQGLLDHASLPGQVRIRWHDYADSYNRLRVPDGWTVTESWKQLVVVMGPGEARVAIGVPVNIFLPGLRAYPPGAYVMPHSDPVSAFIGLAQQSAARAGQSVTPRIISVYPKPSRNGGQSAWIDATVGVAVNGQPETYRLLAHVYIAPPTGTGMYLYYYSELRAPERYFPQLLPYMIRIWSSYGNTDRLFVETMNKVIGNMREIQSIATSMAESRDRAMERAHYDWVEYIRGTQSEYDRQTGEFHDRPLYDIKAIVEEKNRQEAWDRYEQVPLRELMMGEAGRR